MVQQKTIRKTLYFEGIGIHTGINNWVRLSPAPIDQGILFKIFHGHSHRTWKASIENISDTTRQVTIGFDEFKLMTIEHLLSALSGLGITNCTIESGAGEMPILDGSARIYIDGILDAGIVPQLAEIPVVKIPHPLWIVKENKYIVLLPESHYRIHYSLSYPGHPILENQQEDFVINEDTFVNEICSARTFGFYEEWEQQKEQGLALGGSFENTLVYDANGIMNQETRCPRESVRHKILDVIGDFSIVGFPIQGFIIANKTGHTDDILLVQKIVDYVLNNRFTKQDIKDYTDKFENEIAKLIY